jgi:L-2,4-diaminobutyrate decarboxylase
MTNQGILSNPNDIYSNNSLSDSFKQYFLSNSNESVKTYQTIISEVAGAIANQIQSQTQPYSGKSPADLRTSIEALDLFPKTGKSLQSIFKQTKELVIESNISVYHPHCLAHLHCPTFIASLAAEMIISAFNQSLDSWDQSPAASMIEQALCDKICSFYGFNEDADATFTGGGTMSNFMGLLLARDHYSLQNFNWNIQQKGFPLEASKFRILCAENAHFTVTQSASILGLGENAIVKIKGIDESASLLEKTILDLKENGLIPIAYVTTAGTTDFGSLGKIGDLADMAHQHGLWIHVDAAYGGALMFSRKHKRKLEGIEKADSLTIDFHKLFYQPISCGVFIAKNKKSFNYIKLHAAYLNPESNENFGILDLVYKSIQTTRRFDALKPFIALQHIGLDNFEKMLDYTIELAEEVSFLIEQDPQFELAYKTPINAVVFRYLPKATLTKQEVNNINDTIKTNLLLSGKAIIGQTIFKDKSYLKFTLLNPMTKLEEVSTLLEEIKKQGDLLALDKVNKN